MIELLKISHYMIGYYRCLEETHLFGMADTSNKALAKKKRKRKKKKKKTEKKKRKKKKPTDIKEFQFSASNIDITQSVKVNASRGNSFACQLSHATSFPIKISPGRF